MNLTDSELKAALALNRSLASRASVTHCDDLVGVGHEVIMRIAADWNDEKRAKGSFCAYIHPQLRSYHRRAMVDFLSAVHIPSSIADSNERLGDFVRVDLDALEANQNPLSTAVAPDLEESHESDYDALRAALEKLPPNIKKLVVARYLESKTFSEIKRAHRINDMTFNKYCQAGLAGLRNVLEGHSHKITKDYKPHKRRRARRATA